MTQTKPPDVTPALGENRRFKPMFHIPCRGKRDLGPPPRRNRQISSTFRSLATIIFPIYHPHRSSLCAVPFYHRGCFTSFSPPDRQASTWILIPNVQNNVHHSYPFLLFNPTSMRGIMGIIHHCGMDVNLLRRIRGILLLVISNLSPMKSQISISKP